MIINNFIIFLIKYLIFNKIKLVNLYNHVDITKNEYSLLENDLSKKKYFKMIWNIKFSHIKGPYFLILNQVLKYYKE